MTDWRTWAIDEERVLEDGYSWEEMYRKQRQVPFMVFLIFGWFIFVVDEPLMVLVAIPAVVYSAWPAYGAYTVMKRGQDDS